MPTPIRFVHPNQREVELLSWSDHDLDQMAMLTEQDRQRANSLWRRLLPRVFRTLLAARSTVKP